MPFKKLQILKKPVVLLMGFALVTLAGWKIATRYADWKSRQALSRARTYFLQGRFNEATLSVRSSLQERKQNPEAYQLMAEMMEAIQSAEALPYRKKVAELRTWDPQAKIDLARSALRFNRLDMARTALARVPERQQNRPDFLEVEARVKAASGDKPGAAEAYSRLWRLFPGSRPAKSALLNLAQFYLADGMRGDAEQAVARLGELADDGEYGIDARRLMIRAAFQQGDSPAAFRLSNQLVKMPGAEIEDRLQNLDLMRMLRCPLEAAALAWLERAVEGDPSQTAKMAEWLMNRKGPRAALEWLNRLPAENLKVKPIPIVVADCYSRLADWSSLENFLSGQNWGRLEAQRMAMLAGAYRNTRQEELAGSSWKAAVAAAKKQPGALASLARLAFSEHRLDDALDALWNIPASDPGYREAQGQLFAFYRKKNDSANLLRLTERTLGEHPDDLRLKLSVATLLLVRDQQLTRAAALAREVYQADPHSMHHAAVYAYSLYREKPVETTARAAASILDARPEKDKSSDDCLVYYGLILTACKRYDEARACFQKMNRGLLFPEMLEKVAAAEKEIK